MIDPRTLARQQADIADRERRVREAQEREAEEHEQARLMKLRISAKLRAASRRRWAAVRGGGR